MNKSRRDFAAWIIRGAGAVSLAGAAPLALLTKIAQAAPAIGMKNYDWEKHYWGYGVDIDKCIGCGRCVNACKKENNVYDVPFYFRTWVERYIEYKNGKLLVESPDGGKEGFKEVADVKNVEKSFFVPKICNHCEEPACVTVCPVGATYKTKDGVVLIDQSICLGCRYCIQACPYGARYFNPDYKVADKCTLCYHRITKGMKPACVQNCPVQARIFGDLKDPESPISLFVKEHEVQVLKPHLGTKPKVYYHDLDKEVR